MELNAATIIPTLVSTAIASLVAYGVAFYQSRYDERKAIHDMVTKMIELSMAYPHVESQAFLDHWPDVPGASHDDKLRYEIYCCYVFNVLERVWEYSKDDFSDQSEDTNEILHVPEIIACHRRWWISDGHNPVGYSRSFQRYVDRILLDLKKAE